MALALELASRGRFDVAENPLVGCVLVAGGKPVGQGWHRGLGLPHAEAAALADFGEAPLPAGATAYVGLEPCAHHGRTPPCAQALVRAGVRRVVVACQDPDPRTDGKGIALLREAGIDVQLGVMEERARWLNRGYLSRQLRGRPWVLYKAAVSLDGRTALADGASQWITSPAARSAAQALRASSDAVMVGGGTLLHDDPSLRVRSQELPEEAREMAAAARQPLRAVLAGRRALPPSAKVFGEPGEALVLAAAEDPRLEGVCQQRQVPCGEDGAPDPAQALAALAGEGCNRVLLEGGATLAGRLWRLGLLDEMALMQAPLVLGEEARPLLQAPGPASLDEAERWHLLGSQAVGPDLCSRWVRPDSLKWLLGRHYNDSEALSLEVAPWP